eukprot:s2196_g10.t1
MRQGGPNDGLAGACCRKDFATARALIADGEDVTQLDADNFNAPLHWAAWNGSHSLVEELLLHGALLRQPNAEGLQAVHLAVRNGRLSTLAALWRHEHDIIFATDSEGGTPMHHAANCGFLHVLEWLYFRGAPINVSDAYGLTPLHCAVMAGKLQTVHLLVRRRADPLAVDLKGRVPLHWAALHGRSSLLASVRWEESLGGVAALKMKDSAGKRPVQLTRRTDVCMMLHLFCLEAWGRWQKLTSTSSMSCFLHRLPPPSQPFAIIMVVLTPLFHCAVYTHTQCPKLHWLIPQ